MHQRLVLFMIFTTTIVVFLSDGDRYGRFQFLPGAAGFLPEILSALAVLYVLVEGVRGRFRLIRGAYWIVFVMLLVTIVGGVLINKVDSGPIFAGLRAYLRAVPWFFLPLVVTFSEVQVRRQINFLLLISLLQIPFSIEQRMKAFDFGWAGTGDTTTGTLGDSGDLSVFLVCAVCIVVALFAKKVLGIKKCIVIFLLLLIPTTINETKVVVAILPLGLIAAYMCASEPRMRVKRLTQVLGMLVLFAAIFIPIYDALIMEREDAVTLKDFFSDSEKVERYVSEDKEIGSQGSVRRGDAIRVVTKYFARDPILFVFGYGIGNASESNLGGGFTGAHFRLWGMFLVTTFTKIALELGMLGMFLILCFYWLVLQDCVALAQRSNGFYSGLAAGWAGVIAVISIVMFYSRTDVSPAVSYLFWYFSGIIAAERMRIAIAVNRNL